MAQTTGSDVQRIAMVSLHTSPAAQPGTADAGGMNVAILGLATELAARGVQVDLLTRATGTPRAVELLSGVQLHELAAGPAGALPKDRLAEVTDAFGEAVARLARRAGASYDLIHAHYWLSGIASLPAALELGLPFVQSFHTVAAMKNSALGKGSAEPAARVLGETYLGTQANAVIASSAAEATALIDQARVPASKVWVIPPGVDGEAFAPRDPVANAAARAVLGLEQDRQLLVMAGRVQPLKGHELAVRALGQLRRTGGPVPLLAIAGEVTPGDEQFVDRLRELASELGVSGEVRFVGALGRERLAGLLAAASVTLVPSFSETFGLVALESASAGTIVVASRAGGLTESVEDGVTGVLIDSREPSVWAAQLARLLADDTLRATMGAAGREFAGRFTWGAAAASLLGVYAGIRG